MARSVAARTDQGSESAVGLDPARASRPGARAVTGWMRRSAVPAVLTVLAFFGAFGAGPRAHAQPAPDAPPVSMCQAIADAGGLVHKAASALVPQRNAPDVTIRYVGHSTFRITSPDGVVIATDYAGYAGEGPVPTIVTMNHAHSSHYTDFPDPAIQHVLRGWNPDGDGPAVHHLQVEDVLVRNVATDIRRWGGEVVEPFGNSIFIFETAGLCIGHLGHLHHIPSPSHYAQIGRLDVLFVPVDGGYTMAQAEMLEVVEQLRASVVIPMHFFTIGNLQRFVERMGEGFEVDIRTDPQMTVSLDSLPRTPTLVVLPGY